ncbi:hypothetical protein K445DRAFT_172687 [Daldinia sp. EC12]|nr:hypothetical protein K445DRAFT_172687 [Daldinia sp. EC12]
MMMMVNGILDPCSRYVTCGAWLLLLLMVLDGTAGSVAGGSYVQVFCGVQGGVTIVYVCVYVCIRVGLGTVEGY